MTNLQDITQSYLRSILRYDPETGEWRWRWRTDVPKGWNKRWAGKLIKSFTKGYLVIKINGRRRYAHRLAFIYMGEKLPPEVDHVKCNRGDCRWKKLRAATRSQNIYNGPRRKDNESGYKGVSWNNRDKRWIAQLQVNKKPVLSKSFIKLEDAIAARIAAAEQHLGQFVHHG